MAIDSSIALGQAPQAPLQFAQGLVGLKGQQLQQNALTQQIQANQATSQAVQQSVDPQTGQLDTNKLSQLLSQDPRGAYNLLPTQNAILENQQKQQGLNTSKFDLAKKENDYFTANLAGLASNPNLSPQDFVNMAAGAVKNGLVPPDRAVQMLKDVPSDPAALRQYAQQKLQQSMINAGQFAGVLPQNSQVNTGNQISFVSTDPITGRPTVQGNIQNQMSPGDANSMVQVYDPSSQSMRMVTKAQAAQMATGGQPQMMQGQDGGSTLGLPGTGNNGRYPAQAQQGQQQGSLGIAAGPSLGAGPAADVAATAAAQNANNLANQADGAPQRVMYLQNMAHDLQGFTGGPAADYIKNALSTIQEIAPGMASAAGIDPNRIASQEQFNKYATNLATQAMKGLGGGTDQQLAASVSGNPHAQLSNLSNSQIIQAWIGGERATQAKNMAWQDAQTQGVQPQDYNKWSTQWNSQVDPRVFVAPEMSQADRAKMYNGLKPADQQRFMNSYRTAINSGIIQRPTADNGQ